MLVPHAGCTTNTAGTTVDQQYKDVRTVLAFDDATERTVQVTAANQPCTTFAIHDALPILKTLYDDGDLTFFANTGVINTAGMDRSNYNRVTRTQLFAHNFMQ